MTVTTGSPSSPGPMSMMTVWIARDLYRLRRAVLARRELLRLLRRR